MRNRMTITAAALGLFAILGASAANAQEKAAPQEKARDRAAKSTRDESTRDKSATRTKLNADKFIQRHDKDGDGKLSQEELPGRIRGQFDVLDRDNDRLLSQQELQRHGMRMMRQLQPEAVTFVWIIAAEQDQPSLQELQASYAILRKLDDDQDGQITQSEIKAVRQELCEQRVDSLIKHMDENSDGKISEQEGQGGLDVAFDEVDTNSDGFVSRQELLQCVSGGSSQQRTAERPAATPDRKQ